MRTLTIDEATLIAPSIAANQPINKVSDRYQFVSTREILERVQEKGWRITKAQAQNGSLHSQHRVTLVHENSLAALAKNEQEGVLRIELFNSHNRTKRLTFAIGYFRLVCSNGLIIASGPAETVKAKHTILTNKEQDIKEGLVERIHQLTDKFPTIIQKIEDLKNRILTDEEQFNYATYAIKGRYSYRANLPKRFSNLQESASKILNIRRTEDSGSSAWSVFNRVQENIIRGVPEFTQPVRSYLDDIRVNLLLWKGAETTLEASNEQLAKTLQTFLIKRS